MSTEDPLPPASAEVALSTEDLLEQASDAFVLIDAGGIVRYWNRGAEEMFLFPRAEVLGRQVGFIVPPDLLAADELGEIQRRLERGETVRNLITRRMRKDGVERWVSLTRTLLHDERGVRTGSTALIRDITEQRETEAELSRARQAALAGDMAAKLAHEIKNPLAGIGAAIQVLGRDLAPGDPRKAVFEGIMHEVRRLDDTLLDLLRFARPTPPHRTPLALGSLLEELLEPIRRRFVDTEVSFETAIEPGLVAELDGRLMNQVFENLLVNAAQAVGGAGRVTLAARREEGAIVVEVGDTGPGIAPENLARVFDAFFTTKARGTGLGLSIAHKNVEAHGGRLEAHNRREGGALFRVVLPVGCVPGR